MYVFISYGGNALAAWWNDPLAVPVGPPLAIFFSETHEKRERERERERGRERERDALAPCP